LEFIGEASGEPTTRRKWWHSAVMLANRMVRYPMVRCGKPQSSFWEMTEILDGGRKTLV
jgi:hypothetical protein